MSKPKLRFEETGALGEYNVLEGEGAEVRSLGTVIKFERRYNLRRVYVTRGWRACLPNGHALYSRDAVTASTRAVAAEALWIYRHGTAAELEALIGRL